MDFGLTHVLFTLRTPRLLSPTSIQRLSAVPKPCILVWVRSESSVLQRDNLGCFVVAVGYWWDSYTCLICCSRMWLKSFQSRLLKVCVFVCKMWLLWVPLGCWTVSEASRQLLFTFSSVALSFLTRYFKLVLALFPPKWDSGWLLVPAVCEAKRKGKEEGERERNRSWPCGQKQMIKGYVLGIISYLISYTFVILFLWIKSLQLILLSSITAKMRSS